MRLLTLFCLLFTISLNAQKITILTDTLIYKYDSFNGLELTAAVDSSAFALRSDNYFLSNFVYLLRTDSIVTLDVYSLSSYDIYKKVPVCSTFFLSEGAVNGELLYACFENDSLKNYQNGYFGKQFKVPAVKTGNVVLHNGVVYWLGLDSGLAVVNSNNVNFYALIQDSLSTKFREGQQIVATQDYVFHLDLDRETLRQLDISSGNLLLEKSIPGCTRMIKDRSQSTGGNSEQICVMTDSTTAFWYSADSLKLLSTKTFSSPVRTFKSGDFQTGFLLPQENKLALVYAGGSLSFMNIPGGAKDFLIFQQYNSIHEESEMASWLYPNPASSQEIYLELKLTATTEIQIYNALGALVFVADLKEPGTLHTVQLPTLNPGMYWLKVGEHSSKLVVN